MEEIKYEMSPDGESAILHHPEIGEVWCSKKCLEVLLEGRGDELAFYHINSPEDGGDPFYIVSFKSRRDWKKGNILMDITIHEI